jgi:tRNA threonylcarbamoyladenosine biosynthesis protein TsaB
MLLALDTGTRRAAVAVGDGVSEPIAARTWAAGYRHGEELLGVLEDVLCEAGLGAADIDGIVVGIGPGSFTGLRVGLATAKGLSYGLGIPIVGVGTATALAAAAWEEPEAASAAELTVLLPAGPHDRYAATFVRGDDGRPSASAGPVLLPGGPAPTRDDGMAPASGTTAPPRAGSPGGRLPLAAHGVRTVAVDLDGPAPTAGAAALPAGATALGARAQARLGAALLSLGAAALAAGAADPVAELVPAYVTLPRGVGERTGEISWSRDPG